MRFKPGDKVWVHHPSGDCEIPAGTYAGVLVGIIKEYENIGMLDWWSVHVPDVPLPPGALGFAVHESSMTPRDDPPREQVGSWDHCVWRPDRVPECA